MLLLDYFSCTIQKGGAELLRRHVGRRERGLRGGGRPDEVRRGESLRTITSAAADVGEKLCQRRLPGAPARLLRKGRRRIFLALKQRLSACFE